MAGSMGFALFTYNPCFCGRGIVLVEFGIRLVIVLAELGNDFPVIGGLIIEEYSLWFPHVD